MLSLPAAARAQLFPQKPAIQLRIGAFLATPLVSDEVSSRALDDSIPGARSDRITIKQRPGPIGTLALRMPLRATTQLEVNASVARSTVRGDDNFESWDVADVTIANFMFGFGYLYRGVVALRAGVGLTKLFAEERALFARGNALNPAIEGGVSTGVSLAGRPIELDLRVQAHSFSTAALRDDGGSSGNVARAVLQIGTNIWQAGR